VPVEGAEDSINLSVDEMKNGTKFAPPVKSGDLIIGITASGRTPYVKGAFDYAKKISCKRALISTNPNALLKDMVDIAILPETGNEIITGSTRMKSGTAQKLVLNTFSTALMIRLGKTYSNLMINVLATNKKLIARKIRLIKQATDVSTDIAKKYLNDTNGNLKVAIVSLLANCSVEKAKLCLKNQKRDIESFDQSGIRGAVNDLLNGI
jgi:N-acetylmuramic acid 6-phosphate etherase